MSIAEFSDCGAIVVCGGHSSRMGSPKGLLPFGSELMLQRIVRVIREVVTDVVVVAAAGQELPALPPDVIIARDRQPDQGPLEGIVQGLMTLPTACDVAYVSGCDVPLLQADWIRELLRLRQGWDVVVPRDGSFHHPLSAVYHRRCVGPIELLLSDGRRRPVYLFDCVRTREVDVESLRFVDPELQSIQNVNTPDAYQRALGLARKRDDVGPRHGASGA